MIEANGITVDDDVHEKLKDIVENKPKQVNPKYPEGSFHRLFWEQQQKAEEHMLNVMTFLLHINLCLLPS